MSKKAAIISTVAILSGAFVIGFLIARKEGKL